MGFISTIIAGIVIGVVAKFLMPGKNEPQGFILTALLGVVGVYVGGFLSDMLGIGANGGMMWWIASIVGAIVVLAVYGMITKPKA